ncbi:PTS ascorbate transporter subunit IIC [Criibacterium bergeronii]|uniref:PTS ascorbate transporter subunit IIC n=1 Tax=Criibacterium bergeronii TaxID=1871336 RepID=A0A371IP52_9FIRM|nr:PTS ascorbate transporter subunit IIC [Criibacterium bergeronii]MBS6062478.1 PTS ascorbate transporter subunit IIC [Peptostreptococcaceae bacterium]RDY22226.1 PTS ascorbate transporter subunit IIC [Criibacterium bergeronii]
MANKKQIPLRISQELFDDLNAWAQSDFRSVNGQIEYLLTLCVKEKKKSGKYVPKNFNNENNE